MSNEFINYGVFDKNCLLNTKYEYKSIMNNDDEFNKFLKNIAYNEVTRMYFKIVPKEYNNFTYNDLHVSYENFEWMPYLSLNDDLKCCGLNGKDSSWNHWINHGRKEERAFSYVNNSNNHRGRLGNIFFINMFLHFISEIFDLKSNYKYASIFKDLGFQFYTGSKIYNSNLLITEKNFLDVLCNPGVPSNIIIDNQVWFHNKKFSEIIKDYIYGETQKKNIINSNYFKKRYNNNNDVFIHLRLGDMSDVTEKTYDYYKNILNGLQFDKGFISSDSIRNDICIKLIKEFNLCAINKNEQETIMFASTNKYIILSGGTFSWLIGLLSFFSDKIYYPKLQKAWYGTEIFDFPNWIGINV